MITSRIASEVTAKKSLDHRIHLVGNFELVEMAGTHSAAIDEILQPLRDQRRRDALRRCCQMQRRHFAQCRSGLTIELESTPDGAGGDVRRRGQHHSHYLLHELPVGVWQEHAFDPLPAGPVIASLDAGRHRLNGGASIWRISKRRVHHDYGADAVGMGSSQLQDDHATHAVADRHNLTEALVFNDVSEIVGISRDRVWPRGFVALAMSAQIYGNDAMLAGEVLGLRGEERAIARRSVDENKSGPAGATIFKGQLRAVVRNRRHDLPPVGSLAFDIADVPRRLRGLDYTGIAVGVYRVCRLGSVEVCAKSPAEISGWSPSGTLLLRLMPPTARKTRGGSTCSGPPFAVGFFLRGDGQDVYSIHSPICSRTPLPTDGKMVAR